MVDYRKFLEKTETMVLPYLGGAHVHAPSRRLRVTDRVDAGWWEFEIKGRLATPKSTADPPSLDELPAVRGHVAHDWLFTQGGTAHRLQRLTDEEPQVLSPVTARRWPGDIVLFDTVEFEDEPEEAARSALANDETIGGLKGATPSLRGAFGFATLVRAGRSHGQVVSAREVLDRVHDVADKKIEAMDVLTDVASRRFRVISGFYEQARRPPIRDLPTATPDNAEERAATVLEAAGAELRFCRVLGDRNLEVTFSYLDEHFIAVVDWETLHVYDSGICLEGADEMLGLDALPSVIAEAVGNGELYITRRS